MSTDTELTGSAMILVELDLQLIPTRTVRRGLKEAVEKVFGDMALKPARWTTPVGEDRHRAIGVEWAEPTLYVRVLAPGRSLHDAIARPPAVFGESLAELRRTLPDLGVLVTVIGTDRSIWLATRRSQPPETVQAAFRSLPGADVGPDGGAYGWDSNSGRWIPI